LSKGQKNRSAAKRELIQNEVHNNKRLLKIGVDDKGEHTPRA
jgi:hypothetical protein